MPIYVYSYAWIYGNIFHARQSSLETFRPRSLRRQRSVSVVKAIKGYRENETKYQNTKKRLTMGAVLTRLLEVFWTKKLDIVVIGLENRYAIYPSSFSFEIWKLSNEEEFWLTLLSPSCSGKTTLLSVLAHGAPVETVPTIGLNVKVFKKGSVNMKCWDIGTSAIVWSDLEGTTGELTIFHSLYRRTRAVPKWME
jgi:hypothetical protein